MESTVKPRITRRRELRACTECRRRKLRCDRHLPCNSCVRRNDSASCAYERQERGQQEEHERRLHAEERLEHLEQLVQQLSQQTESDEAPTSRARPVAAENEEGRDPEPVIPSIPYNESVFRGSGPSHWSAMLDDIEELRSSLTTYSELDEPELAGDDDADGTSLLFGATRSLSYREILAQFLPPRRDSDRLVATYFRTKAIAAPFIHAEQFNRLYQSFWEDPLLAPPLWTSILFTILEIASKTLSTRHTELGQKTSETFKDDRFSLAAAGCLAVGEYYKAKRFAVEALLLYAQRKCFANFDMPPELATIFGTLIRLAMTLGYHRDPDHYQKGLSAFEGEMRRRTWSLCMQLELLVSFQLGLPSTIQGPAWDTSPPKNLMDSDIHESMISDLPPGRPDSEPTTLLFYIAKHKLMAVFERIIRHISTPTDSMVDELEAIDQELRSTHASLPAYLQPRPMAESIADSSSIIVTRLCVDQIFNKCLCVLHRRHVALGRQESVYTCYDSASNIIRRFLDVYKEFRPGGQLETEKWFMSSITWHDFLLGCMALCLVLCSTRQMFVNAAGITQAINLPQSLDMLQKAKAICDEYPTRSRDTQKVRLLLEATIKRFGSEYAAMSTQLQTLAYDNQSMISHTAMSEQVTSGHRPDDVWAQTENTMTPIDEEEWKFLRQYLNLSYDELHDPQ